MKRKRFSSASWTRSGDLMSNAEFWNRWCQFLERIEGSEPIPRLFEFIEEELTRERQQCAAIAVRLHGCDGDQIAAEIMKRCDDGRAPRLIEQNAMATRVLS